MREEREVNKKNLDVSYSAHLKIDVHCSGEAKILLIAPLLWASFMCNGAKK